MALIRRIDHVILCARDRREWVPAIERVLGLRPGRSREGDEWGFANAEFDIGDGFLGLVEPAGPASQLDRFLDRHPEGFYALSVDVGDLAGAARHLEARGVPFRRAMRGEEVSLLWVPPGATGGVLYQLTRPVPLAAGANPEYLGVPEVVIGVDDLDRAVDAYRRCFDLEPGTVDDDERLGARRVVLGVPGAPGGDRLVLAAATRRAGPLGVRMAESGPGLFQFTIAVRDLDAELRRLADKGVRVHADRGPAGAGRAWIDPAELSGVRVELRQEAPRGAQAPAVP